MESVIEKKFDTLYTLDSKGKVRVFEAEVYYKDGDFIVSTSTGLFNGKLTPQRTIIKKGKQGRDTRQQAVFEAASEWNKKWDEGYKSLKHIEEKWIDLLQTTATLSDYLVKAFIDNPQFSYTNQNGDELPMLAHKFKDVKTPEYPYIIQPKLDGVRCLVKFKDNKAVLTSRGGQYYQIPHLIDQLTIFLNRLYEHNHSVILDGEIYEHGTPLQEISGAARTEAEGMFASNSWLEYHIYDVVSTKNLKATQRERDLLLTIIQEYAFDVSSIKFIESKKVYSKDEVLMVHEHYVSKGYEGAILRNPFGVYEFNQRSKSLLKVKEYQDDEFEIIGCGSDEGKSIGESFYFVLKNNINDLTFKSRPTGTEKDKEHWYYNINEYIGKKATVRYFARSNDGLPTQGVVRHKDTGMLVKHIRPDGE